jgi:hypothetical protein
MLDLAGSNDIYSGSWSGPPPSSYKYRDGLTAGNLLLAGLRIGNGTTSAPNGSSPSGTSSPGAKSTAGAIAGGVVGGIVVIALLALLLILMHRHRWHVKARGIASIAYGTVLRRIGSPMTSEVEPFRLPSRPPRRVPVEKKAPDAVAPTTSLVPSSTNPPTSSATAPSSVGDAASLDVTLVNQLARENGERGTATIQSLLIQLSDILQRRNHNRDGDENPPEYSQSNPV